MRKLTVLLLILTLVSCGKTVTDVPETIPETEPLKTEPPEEVSQPVSDDIPFAVPLWEVPPAEVLEADPNSDAVQQEIIQPEPAFAPVSLLINDLGDMEKDPEGYYYFVKDKSVEIEYGCGITMDFPRSWELTVSTAQDIPRTEAGWFSTKRMEFYDFLYRTPDDTTDASENTTPDGLAYRYWEETGGTMDRLGAVWHHCEFPVQLGTETYRFHIYFLTFSNDPAGYFEEYIQPVIDSIAITVDQ